MPLKHRTQQQGFSMVVIAGLFTAFAIIAAAAIDRNTAGQQITRQEAAVAQLKRINLGLVTYAIVNANRFPCPSPINAATSSATFGAPVAACESSVPAGTELLKLTDNTTDSSIIRGGVPFTALANYGVDPSDAIDPWGNRIAYSVHRQLTVAGNGTATSGNGATATDRAVITDNVANTAINSPDFVLVSYGRDGIGAIPSAGTGVTISCTANSTVLREENCDSDLTFLIRPPYTHSNATASNYFDDIVSFYALQ